MLRRDPRPNGARTPAVLWWALVAFVSFVALLAAPPRSVSFQGWQQRAASGLERDRAQHHRETLLDQHGVVARTPGMRPSSNADSDGRDPPNRRELPRMLLAARAANRAERIAFHGPIAQHGTTLQTWAPRPKTQTELMVFLN